MADEAKIIEAIEQLAIEKNGTLNLDKASVRKVRKLVRSSPNQVTEILTRLRLASTSTQKNVAENHGEQRTDVADDTDKASALGAEHRTPSLRFSTVPAGITSWSLQGSAMVTYPAGQYCDLTPYLSAKAPNGCPYVELKSSNSQSIADALPLMSVSPLKVKTALQDKEGPIASLNGLPFAPEDGGQLPTYPNEAARKPDNYREDAGRAAEKLLLSRCPLVGVEIFDALDQDLQNRIGRRRIQEVLRWSQDNLANLVQLHDGKWWVADLPPPITYPRRRPPHAVAAIQNNFATFAVNLMNEKGRPFGAVELFDHLPKDKPRPFDRACSSHMLAAANHPALAKRPDGTWWLVDREAPPMPPRGGYHSRVRAPYYLELGEATLAVLLTNCAPMTGSEIQRALPPSVFQKIVKRNKINELLSKASRDFPQLFRNPNGMWWIKDIEQTSERSVSIGDKLALKTIEILRKKPHALKAPLIRALLPDELKKAFASIHRPLCRLQTRYRELVLNDDKSWTVAKSIIREA